MPSSGNQSDGSLPVPGPQADVARKVLSAWALVVTTQLILLGVMSATALPAGLNIGIVLALACGSICALGAYLRIRQDLMHRVNDTLVACITLALLDTGLLLWFSPSFATAQWSVLVLITAGAVIRPSTATTTFKTLAGTGFLVLLATGSTHTTATLLQEAAALASSVLVGHTLSAARSRSLRVSATALKNMHQLATTDPLTGLANRRAWIESAQLQLALAQRQNLKVAVALADLDHFKAYNDQYGHAGGDTLLTGFADAVRNVVRGSDLIGRWGGEEFVLLFPDCSADGALSVLARLQATIPNNQTASFGVVTWDGQETLDMCLRRADLTMYRAKSEGRARVVVS